MQANRCKSGMSESSSIGQRGPCQRKAGRLSLAVPRYVVRKFVRLRHPPLPQGLAPRACLPGLGQRGACRMPVGRIPKERWFEPADASSSCFLTAEQSDS